MTAAAGSLVLLGVLCIPVAAQQPPDAPPSGKPALTFRIVDLASVPASMLEKAALTAEAMLRNAGIESEWLPPCSAGDRGEAASQDCASVVRGVHGEIEIRIVNAKMMDATVPLSVLGLSNRDASAIYVLYPHIEVSRLAAWRSRFALLGSVMAHEAGHVLGLAHSFEGIMRADFRASDIRDALLSRLKFTEEQAGQLRKAAVVWAALHPPSKNADLASNAGGSH
jgi:hypothetical protein